MTVDQGTLERPGGRIVPAARGAVVGLTAGAVTVGVAELVAGVMTRVGWASGTPSPVDAVGGAFVDLTPAWLKDWAIGLFGTHDKVALYVGIAIVLVLCSIAVGMLAARAVRLGLVALALLVAVAVVAVCSRPQASPGDVAPIDVGGGAGLWMLWSRARPPADEADVERRPVSRRALLGSGLGAVVAGAAAVAMGRVVAGGARAAAVARSAFVVPKVAAPVAVPAGADLGIAGVTPFIVPAAEFYRIDTALAVPQVDPASWALASPAWSSAR